MQWSTLWTGAGLAASASFFGAQLWVHMLNGAVPSVSRIILYILVPPASMLLWWLGAFTLHFHGLVPVDFYGPFYLVAYTLALGCGLAFSLLTIRFMHFVTYKPLVLPALHGVAGVAVIGIVVFGFIPLFNRSGDGMRVAIRLVIFPAVAEVMSIFVRYSDKVLLDGNVPGASRGFMVAPVSLTMAFIGRFFTTGMNSLGLTIALSLAVAPLEVTMRWTVLQRDKLADRLVAWGGTRCPWVRRCAGRVEARVDACTVRVCSRPSKELLAQRRRWSDLTPAERIGRDSRANYAFVVGDTVSEDIGMLTLIPVAIFFRLPTRIGGQPLPLGDVLLRVGFQWLLELWTDVGPFVTYAACRAWLAWRGDVLYRGVSRAQVAAALAVGDVPKHAAQSAEGGKKGGAILAPGVADMCVIDDSANPLAVPARGDSAAAGGGEPSPMGSMTPSLGASAGATTSSLPGGGEAVTPTATAAASVQHLHAVHEQHSGAGGGSCVRRYITVHPGETLGGAVKASLLCCTVPADDAAALAHIQAARAPLLADDADVLWQRLPWRAVRRAMAPDAAEGEWSWLHWFTYRNELLATRVATAWRRRQRGWGIAFIMLVYVLGTTVIRGYFNTRARCPIPDASGDWYWDACPS